MHRWRFLFAGVLLGAIGMGIFYRSPRVVGDGLAPKAPSPLLQIGRFQMADIPGHIYVLDTATGQVWEKWATPSSKDFLEPRIKTTALHRGAAALEEVSALQRELKKLSEQVRVLERRLAKRPKPKEAAEPELRYEGKPLRYWMQTLQDRCWAFRAKAAVTLGEIGPKAKASIPMLLDALKDSVPKVRAAAARGLGGIGARESIPASQEALKDKEPEVRLGVVKGLGGMKGAGGVAVPVLLQTLEDPQPEVAYEVFVSLGKLGLEAKAAVPELIRMAKGPKSGWKTEALETLRQIAPEEADKIAPQPNREEPHTPGRPTEARRTTDAGAGNIHARSLRENEDPSPLPSPGKLENMKATYHDSRENKEVTFAVPKKHWEKIWNTLLPATRDNQPAKWEEIGRLELKLKSGGQFIVQLYGTEKGPGAFAAGETFERRAYYRGGNSKQFQAAMRAAYLDSRRED